MALHCEATGANAQSSATLAANRLSFVADWAATAGELGECTRRLVSGLRVPKFANEHAEAVARELMSLRRERAAARTQLEPTPPTLSAPPPGCPLCGDTGLVTVPLYLCVEAPRYDPPRLVVYPGYRGVLTGSVLCDAGGCGPGRRARDAEAKATKPRPTLTAYRKRCGGVDVVALLAEHDRAVVAAVRQAAGPSRSEFVALIERIKARAAGTSVAETA